jgi:adenylosuccinate lyase
VEIEVLNAQIRHFGWPTDRLSAAVATPAPTTHLWRAATHRTGHEFVGFLDAWDVPWVHIGLTSSDVIDTTLAMRLKSATEHLLGLAIDLRTELGEAAWRWRDTPRLGRTHGQPAVRSVLGHRFADFAHAMDRCVYRLRVSQRQVSLMKISGPVGTYEQVPREVEQEVAASLGLIAAPVSTQIVMRDSLADWAGVLATTAAVCEAVALEVRLSAHGSVHEMAEGRTADQRGSSAMPHKSNPIMAERICGLSRLARAAFEPLAAGVAQFHDRDLAHSSVERTLLPQLAGAVGYSLEATRDLVANLRIDAISMQVALGSHSVDTQTHAAQTHLQRCGFSHRDAQRIVNDAWRRNHNAPSFWREIDAKAGVDHETPVPDVLAGIKSARQLGALPTAEWKLS